MKVTTKGQITVPQPLRERFGLQPETEVEIIANEDTLVVRPLKQDHGSANAYNDWILKAAGSARTRLTTDQILSRTREEN